MNAPRGWPALALIAALALVYGPYVASGGLLAVNDGLGYYFPVRALAAISMRMGEFPFWNPVGFAGMPLHGMLQAGVFFPLNWFFLVLPPVAAMNADVLASSLLAGVSMYAFLRALGTGRAAGLAAALPYMLAGYLEVHLEQLTSVQVTALIPALLWAVERYRQTLDPRRAVVFCLLYALQLLAGYPQTSLFALIIAWAYGWYRGCDLETAAWRPYMVQLALAGGLGLGLAAVELLPVVQTVAESGRLALSYGEIVWHSLPPHQLPMLLFPFMFGGPLSPLVDVPYWGAGPFLIELQGYAGLAPWALALVALAALRGDRRVRFFAGLGLVGGLLSLGGYTPIYRLWAALPILNAIRVPGRHVLELDLALVVLAGLGLQRLLDAEPARRVRLALLGAGSLGLAMAGVTAVVGLGRGAIVAHFKPWLPPRFDLAPALALSHEVFWLPWACYAATALALAVLAYRPRAGTALLLLALYGDVALFARANDWSAYRSYPGPLEARLPDSPYRTISVTFGVPMYEARYALALHAPLLTLFAGERSASGYEAFIPRRYGAMLGGMDNMGLYHQGGPFQAPNHVLDLLGVRTAYVRPVGKVLQAVPTAPRWNRLADQGQIQVWENPRALPRAWRATRATTLGAAEVDRRVTADPAFDPATEALLEDAPAPTGLTPGPTKLTTLSPNRLRVETEGTGPGLVVVSERFTPGWHATTADGHALPVLQADGLVLAVAVPPGRQVVELAYRTPGWGRMVAASLASLVACIIWLLLARRCRPADPA